MADRPPDEAFAQHLLKGAFATDAQIQDALRAQAESAAAGTPLPLGDILVRQGIVSAAQRQAIEKKLETQREDAKRLGPYRILKKLGEGGMGAVYLAEDPATGQKVALKVLPKVAAREEDAVRRFMREVDSARKLDHPNIVHAGAAGEDKGFHYYIMEYVEGETLGGRLKREEALSPDEATKIVLQIAHGLKYAHGQGFIHRDIKPDNVVVSKEGVAKILDMGLSKNIDEAQTFRTVTGVALGTPHYIAPEQARGDKGIDGRADIYSLGATYYHLVTGETPFHGTTAIELIAQHLNKQIPDPRDIRDGIPDGVVHVIRNMMAKKPNDRCRDCAELVADLELVLGGRNPSSQALDAAHSAVALPMAREARERYRAQRRGQRPGTYRATTRSKSSSAPLVIGGVVAAVVLVIVLAVAMGGGSTSLPPRAIVKQEPDPELPKPRLPDKPTAPIKTREELRAEEAQRKLDEIEAAKGRFAPNEIRRRYAEWAKEYADTARGKTIADWLKSTEPNPAESAAADVKPDSSKVEESTPPKAQRPPGGSPTAGEGVSPPPKEGGRPRIERTPMVGGLGGVSFDECPSPGQVDDRLLTLVVGLKYSLGNESMVKSLQPIYLTGNVRSEGKARGQVLGSTFEVIARPGYAVAGMIARGCGRVHAIKVIFRKLGAVARASESSYESDWIGGYPGGYEVKLGGDETWAIGIHGRMGQDLDAIGLIVGTRSVVSARAAPPDVAKQREAEATVKKAFPIDQAKTPKDKADLARTLLQTAATSGAKDADLYVLLRQARDLAAQGMDAKTALEAIDARAAAFDVDALAEKVDVLAKTTAKGPDAAAWAGAALDVADEASEGDDYETAVKLAARAEALARAANDKGLQETAKERGKELADLKRVADGLGGHFKTLETKPDDPAANVAVGKFVSLVKGDWKRGLPMLAKGSDAGLKNLAEQESANPTDASAQVALGRAWKDQAERETPTFKTRARGRAGEWLLRAIPRLTGLEKVLAEKERDSLGPATGTRSRQSLDLGGGVRMELLYIKPGTFTMGGTQAPGPDWQVDERPEHRATLTKGYSLGKYEVTRGQFAAFVRATGYKTEAEREGKGWGLTAGGQYQEIAGNNWVTPATFTQADDHPVTCMSWNDAKAFCDWAAKKTGRGVRLPTEAEWEYACRAGTKTTWSFGDQESAMTDYGWNNKNPGWATHSVGQKKPNPWGLFDMHGNVWEWCGDWAAAYAGDAVDPTGPANGNHRVLRGGDWGHDAPYARSAFRHRLSPSYRGTNHGFRVAVP